jgi:hypothetical protein
MTLVLNSLENFNKVEWAALNCIQMSAYNPLQVKGIHFNQAMSSAISLGQ